MDATLKGLSLDRGTLTPAFDPNTTIYTATVGNDVSSVTINAESTDRNASVSGDTGVKSLRVGENKSTVIVTAKNGDRREYHITIQREAAPYIPPNSGDSGDSDTGSQTTVQPSSPSKSDVSTTGEITAGEPDKNGAVNVTGEQIANALKKAQQTANRLNREENDVTVRVNLKKGVMTITLDRAGLDKLIASGAKGFTLNFGGAVSMTFDLAALKEIQQQNSGPISFTATKASLSGDALAAIGSRPAYNLTVSWLANGKTAYIHSFSAGSVSIAIGYTPAAKELPGSLYAVYVDSGKVEWIDQSSYDLGSKAVQFSTTHFSIYGVGYKPESPVFTDIANHWAKEYIAFVADRGLFSGMGGGQLSPNSGMTRAMFVTALGQLAGIDPAVSMKYFCPLPLHKRTVYNQKIKPLFILYWRRNIPANRKPAILWRRNFSCI